MSLNKFMHQRNPYKNNRPDFKKLALNHEGFRKVAKQSLDGKVSIDFKDPACLKALSEALLLNDFGLTVQLPVDRLIPAVPQRLNYLLWLEDLLADKEKEDITGIDIGCGSSCIYPLLGCKTNGWSFIAAEVDELNLENAKENVKRNDYGHRITVVKPTDHTLLKFSTEYFFQHLQNAESDGESRAYIDFSMCNPPFFDTDESASSRGSRPDPSHVSTASNSEKSVTGGEVEFVKKMIDESLELRHKIRIYTSMVGKKSSVSKLKQYLRENNVPNISSTEFCQGRTMRWAIAWTFQEQISFPKSLFQQQKSKVNTGLSHIIPDDISCCQYDIPSLTHYFKDTLLRQLEMKSTTLHQDVAEFVCIVTAAKNNWSHSRRKRRAEKLKQRMLANSDSSGTPDSYSANIQGYTTPPSKKQKLDVATGDTNEPVEIPEPETRADCSQKEVDELSSCDEKPLITFTLELRLEGVHIKLFLKLMDGEQKDMLHQILQHFKNRLK